MRKLIVANWKLNPKTLPAAERLLASLAPAAASSSGQAVFCPPAAYIASLKARFPKLVFGAQDASSRDEGPYTGAIGPSALKSVGAKYAILGHSERRAVFGETDQEIAEKLKAVLYAGLVPILCVGEPMGVRKQGIAAARKFVAAQLKTCTRSVPKAAKIILAYEPVWAISTSGSGKSESAEDAAEMVRYIKGLRPGQVLYGGSVSSKNIDAFLAYREIDGFLVGGASLRPDDFKYILNNA